MGWLALVPGILDAVDTVGKRIAPDKDKRQDHMHAEQLALMAAAAAEYRPTPATWWDSFWDGVNRAPRPLLAFMVLGLFLYAPMDPEGFVRVMRAYQLVPEWLALLAGSIIAFYFGSRHLENRLRLVGPTAAQVALARALARKVAGPDPAAPAPAAPMADPAFREAMADGETPLSDAAIREWNRRRAPATAAADAGGP